MAVMHARPLVALLLILAGTGFFAPLRAQTLAEVAKKEEERRKAVPKPAKVYTNKDLSALPAGSAPPPSAAAADRAQGSLPAADRGRDQSKEGRQAASPRRIRPTGLAA